MNTRDWPIRKKLFALVAVPVAALLVLWAFATTLALGPALTLLSAPTLLEEFGRPGEAVVVELQRERRLSVVYLAGSTDLPALTEQRVRTDRAVADLRRRMAGEDLRDAATELLIQRLGDLAAGLDALPAGRASIDQRGMDRPGALGLYSSVVTTAFQAFDAMVALPDEGYNRQARALTLLGHGRELLAQADALVAGAATADGFLPGEHNNLVQIIGNHRLLVTSAVADLPTADRIAYERLTGERAFRQLEAMQRRLLVADPVADPPIALGDWRLNYDTVQERMRDFELDAADALAERTIPLALGILGRLAAAGLVGLVAVAVSVLVALRVGRSLVQRLTGVRSAALEMAGERLPTVVARLRRGEEVEIEREVPPLEYGNDEIGQVGRAFNEVQRTAVRSAVDEATLRRGLNEVFLNIARRSQSLLHRQLTLLDRMERRTEAPEELAELFRIDHLATRMRRHAEDLVILAGAAPGRGWRNPVAMIDVIRGAVSEIESYDRVEITSVSPAATVGRAVGDVIHLLAELIENATAFSAPQTRVRVSGEPAGEGYAIAICDQGFGLSAEALAEANRRLAHPPDFDPADSARLGLFVVARLAARHGIGVRLGSGPAGGVTALVQIPADLVAAETSPVGRPAGEGAGQESRRLAQVRRLTTVPRRPSAEPAGGSPGWSATGGSPGRSATGGLPGRSATDGLPSRSSGRRSTQSGEGARRAPLRAAPPPQPDAAPESLPGTEGLPRRIRQRSLAPQLRQPTNPAARSGWQQHPAASAPTSALPTISGSGRGVPAAPAARSPEEIRAVMSSLQAGTARGRQAAAPTGSPAAGAGWRAPTPWPAPPTADSPTTELPRVRSGAVPAAETDTDTDTGRDA